MSEDRRECESPQLSKPNKNKKQLKLDKSIVRNKKLNRRLSRLLKYKAKQAKRTKFYRDYFTLCDEHCEICSRKVSLDTSVFVALDCEFVGVGENNRNALGRCSIVDFSGNVICDIYSRPDEPITDYRTRWSGLRPDDFFGSIPFECAKTQISSIIKDKVVIGQAVHNDFRVLEICPPRQHIIDTSKSQVLKEKLVRMGVPVQGLSSLKNMAYHLLGWRVQSGEHCSVEDSQACMELFRLIYSDLKETDFHLKKKTCRSKKKKPFIMEISKEITTDRGDVESSNKSFLDDEFWPDEQLDM